MSVQESSRARGVDRVVSILKQLHGVRRPMTMRELIEATGAPRSSIYELVTILTEAGWLEAGTDGSVFFGREMHYYGSDYAVHNDLISRAHQAILGLVRSHDETAQLCMLEGNKYTVVLSENSSRPFNISSDIGVKVPIPWTASGRLLLGHLSADEIRALIPQEDFVLDNGKRIAVPEFLGDVERAAQQGYFCTEGLSHTFRYCMAAPVRDKNGQAVAALCFMTSRDTDPNKRAAMLEDLIRAAKTLSQPYYGMSFSAAG
ncbi:MAG: IclR family transcriptional regulator [Caballeronia sp.]|jgi:DNA-binding IclR family transcriptional regulator|uniref:IclR family transcriptional regulator n=1 Tax=Caballeronia sp. TaxID=1931223 RepID=UPI002631B1B7|nr:IclR family transcriptional regulator [Caballeronia sp.]MDB5830951.1 IclR family transcriptional regulator [Caballeronia sp.]